MEETKPQLVHSAHLMLAARAAKYNDPNNLEWEWDNVTDKWERHAFSAFMDLQATESQLTSTAKERDSALVEVERLKAIVSDPEKWMKWCDVRVLEANETLEADLRLSKAKQNQILESEQRTLERFHALELDHNTALRRVEELEKALRRAKEAIKIWHGEDCWEIYDQGSPEMKAINAALKDEES